MRRKYLVNCRWIRLMIEIDIYAELLMRTKLHIDWERDTANGKWHDPIDNDDGWFGTFDNMTTTSVFAGIDKGQFAEVTIVPSKKKAKKGKKAGVDPNTDPNFEVVEDVPEKDLNRPTVVGF